MYPILVDLGVWQIRSYGVFVAVASLIVLRHNVWRVVRPALR